MHGPANVGRHGRVDEAAPRCVKRRRVTQVGEGRGGSGSGRATVAARAAKGGVADGVGAVEHGGGGGLGGGGSRARYGHGAVSWLAVHHLQDAAGRHRVTAEAGSVARLHQQQARGRRSSSDDRLPQHLKPRLPPWAGGLPYHVRRSQQQTVATALRSSCRHGLPFKWRDHRVMVLQCCIPNFALGVAEPAPGAVDASSAASATARRATARICTVDVMRVAFCGIARSRGEPYRSVGVLWWRAVDGKRRQEQRWRRHARPAQRDRLDPQGFATQEREVRQREDRPMPKRPCDERR